MADLLSLLIYCSPVIVNIVCIVLKRGKIISLIITLIGLAMSLLLLLINSGYGIGFGNPWIGVDWQITIMYLVYIAVILITHAFIPAEGIVKKISIVFLVLAIICTLLAIGLEILNTIEHL